jgi:hypothetical protein
MRTIAYILALGLVVAFSMPTFAGDAMKAKTKVDCEKVGALWDAKTNSCLRFG